MKRLLIVILLFSLALTLFACAGTAGLTENDLAIRIGDFTATPKTTMDDVRAAMGEEDDYAEAISCVYQGMDKTFTYDNVIFYTYPDGEVDRLIALYKVHILYPDLAAT